MGNMDMEDSFAKIIYALSSAVDANDRINTTIKFINERIEEYKATITEANKDYNNGLLQTCVKVELETVNYNMIKVLSKVRELLENDRIN